MLSILIPTIRPAGRDICIESVKKTCQDIDYEIITEEDKKRIGCPKMLAKLLKKSKGDKIVFLGDDTELYNGCIQEALRAETYLPDGWGMVGLNDGRPDEINLKASTHFLLDKRLIPLIGGEIFHTGYIHCYCDDELALRARLLGRYAYAKNAKINHKHPANGNGVSDADYQRVYSKEVYDLS